MRTVMTLLCVLIILLLLSNEDQMAAAFVCKQCTSLTDCAGNVADFTCDGFDKSCRTSFDHAGKVIGRECHHCEIGFKTPSVKTKCCDPAVPKCTPPTPQKCVTCEKEQCKGKQSSDADFCNTRSDAQSCMATVQDNKIVKQGCNLQMCSKDEDTFENGKDTYCCQGPAPCEVKDLPPQCYTCIDAVECYKNEGTQIPCRAGKKSCKAVVKRNNIVQQRCNSNPCPSAETDYKPGTGPQTYCCPPPGPCKVSTFCVQCNDENECKTKKDKPTACRYADMYCKATFKYATDEVEKQECVNWCQRLGVRTEGDNAVCCQGPELCKANDQPSSITPTNGSSVSSGSAGTVGSSGATQTSIVSTAAPPVAKTTTKDDGSSTHDGGTIHVSNGIVILMLMSVAAVYL